MNIEVGHRLGRYEIISPVGAGGMGVVYRARDGRLGRTVAIKILATKLANDPEAVARFRREAKAVAALSHPNILAIFDVGSDQGLEYLVAEFLEGETLRARLRHSQLPWRQAIEIGMAIADGLAAAHARGVVHRDLKPENIFLTSDGGVKLLDFGLARIDRTTADMGDLGAADRTTLSFATHEGELLGTPHYMSPEQVRGLASDARSDIFSFGCVMYEMVSGKQAFAGKTLADVIAAIVHADPDSILATQPEANVELDRVIERCLAKEADKRFPSAKSLGSALRALPRHSNEPKSKERIENSLRTGTAVPNKRMLAVLPFENLSCEPDSEYFSDGLTDEMIAQLGRLNPQKLGVIARTSAMRYKRTIKAVEEIGKELGVCYIVEGSVRQAGNRVRITARLVQVSDQSHLWGDSYERELKDIFAVQSEITQAIARQIQITLTPGEQRRVAEPHPVDPEAYQSYLKGRYFLQMRTTDGLAKAVRYFQDAITRAPDWALAHVGLSSSYVVMPVNISTRPVEAYPYARRAAIHALELDDTSPEAHSVLGMIATWYDWDWTTAEREHQCALALDPNYATGHQFYSDFLVLTGRLNEAQAEIEKALELDPISLAVLSQAGIVYYFAGDYQRAIQMNQMALEIVPEFCPARGRLAKALLMQGKEADAMNAIRQAQHLSSRPLAVASLIAARCGEVGEAERILDELLRLEKSEYVSPNALVFAHAAVGNLEQTFYWMERAFRDRLDVLLYALQDPLLAELRSDPRHADLWRRIGFPHAPPT